MTSETFWKIIGVAAPTASATFLGWQIILQRKEANKRFDYQKKEKAVEISQIFAESIKESNYAISVIESFKISSVMRKIQYNKLEHFDFDEFSEILKYSPIEYLTNVQLKSITTETLKYKYEKFGNKKIPSNTTVDQSRLRNFLEIEFYHDLYGYLNKTEWISMSFVLGLADDECVYRSLHQLFLLNIKAFYFHIALTNNSGIKDKYYCNIINLYNKWAERYHNETQKEKEEIDKKNKEIKSMKELDKKKKKEETFVGSDDFRI